MKEKNVQAPKAEATVTASKVEVAAELKVEAKEANAEKAVTKKDAKEKTEKKAEKKAAEKKVVEKKVTEKKEKKVVAKKATAKKTTKKSDSKVIETKVSVQYYGNEIALEDLLEAAKANYIAEGGKEKDIKKVELYIKPEDNATYYVVNGERAGKVTIFA